MRTVAAASRSRFVNAVDAGLTLLTGVLANVRISVSFAIWIHHGYVLPEERCLRNRFGAAYDE
jgi:protein-S-isoprenylcysteine O-methyltransferase Ste14